MIALRQSSLNDYERCPFMCGSKYGTMGTTGRADEEEITNKYALIGIVFHETCEAWGRAKMKGVTLPLESLHVMIDDKLNALDISFFKDENELEDYRVSLHEQLNWVYDKCLFEYVTPIGVEVNFKLDNLIPGVITCTGTIDRIVGDISKREVDIEDYKTGHPYTKKELNTNMQATMYSLAFYKMFGFLPKRFIFYFSKYKKIKTIEITPDFIQRGTERILNNYYKMAQNLFEPDNSNKFFCKNFCSETKFCPLQKKRNNGWDNVG
jgi:CRISPR/Cas system-associated exonuclease Cas4 (RecB family)